MLAAMQRTLGLLLPSFIVATLSIGFATPALADVPPGPRPSPQPDPVAPPEPAPAPAPAPEVKTEPAPEAKTETPPEAKPDAKKADDKKGGSCSIDDDGDRNVLGLAALVLLISGAALRRRRQPQIAP
jgi:MYXO-CTERM domain-containing protein